MSGQPLLPQASSQLGPHIDDRTSLPFGRSLYNIRRFKVVSMGDAMRLASVGILVRHRCMDSVGHGLRGTYHDYRLQDTLSSNRSTLY